MLDEMCATLGGRAAEELFTGHISSGAMNDLERVTKQAYGMIAYMGMGEKLPNLCFYNNDQNRSFTNGICLSIQEGTREARNMHSIWI